MSRKTKTEDVNTPDDSKGVAFGGIGVADLERLMQRQDDISADVSKLSGDSSANLARVEKLGGIKRVFKLVREIRNMDAEHGRDFLRAQFSYLLVLGVFDDLELITDGNRDAIEGMILGPLFQTTAGNPQNATEVTEPTTAH